MSSTRQRRLEFSPAFQSWETTSRKMCRVATLEFSRRYATRSSNTILPALKRRAKFIRRYASQSRQAKAYRTSGRHRSHEMVPTMHVLR